MHFRNYAMLLEHEAPTNRWYPGSICSSARGKLTNMATKHVKLKRAIS